VLLGIETSMNLFFIKFIHANEKEVVCESEAVPERTG
jgi:hypothetical protein